MEEIGLYFNTKEKRYERLHKFSNNFPHITPQQDYAKGYSTKPYIKRELVHVQVTKIWMAAHPIEDPENSLYFNTTCRNNTDVQTGERRG